MLKRLAVLDETVNMCGILSGKAKKREWVTF